MPDRTIPTPSGIDPGSPKHNTKGPSNRTPHLVYDVIKRNEVSSRINVHTCSSNHLCWLAIYVKAGHEKRVASALQYKGYEAFLPTYSKHRRRDRRFDLPLFPGYAFNRIDVSKMLPIVSTPGVFSIVGCSHAPQSISDDEIQGMRRIVESGLTSRAPALCFAG